MYLSSTLIETIMERMTITGIDPLNPRQCEWRRGTLAQEICSCEPCVRWQS